MCVLVAHDGLLLQPASRKIKCVPRLEGRDFCTHGTVVPLMPCTLLKPRRSLWLHVFCSSSDGTQHDPSLPCAGD